MARNNKSNKIEINFDCFLKYFPIGIIIFIMIFMILITICSDNIKPAIPNYQNIKKFTEIYEIPLKLFLILLSIWAILVAYRTYIQTKEQFIILNKAWISSNIKFCFIPIQGNKNVKRPTLLFEIENVGNTPAEQLQVDININPSNIFNFDELNKVPKVLFPKEARTIEIGMGTIPSEYSNIHKSKPFFDINAKIIYSTFDGNKLEINETYKFNYPKLPYVIDSEIYQISKEGERIKLT